MSKIGDTIDQFDNVFDEFFEDDLLITNYEAVDVATGPGEFDDPSEKQATAASPISVRGQVDPASTLVNSQPWIRNVDIDVVIFVDDDVTISDGTVDGLPYSSDVELPDHWKTFRITSIEPEGNGLQRCFATSTPRRGDHQQ